MRIKQSNRHVLRCIASIVGLLILAASFTSCKLFDRLGFDTYDYMSERVIRTISPDSDTAAELSLLLDVLITDSPSLVLFDNTADAIRYYRDAVLEYMLRTDYAKYSGNRALIEKANAKYPEYQISQIIPESEFEATMYRCFGGSVKISHADGGKFKYLPDIGAYISMIDSSDSGYYADISGIDETEKTYRVRFRVKSSDDDIASDEYFALIIKREDGTLYIKKLTATE